MFIALTSANGAPGVSTTALGLALRCENQGGVLLVEADPVGGSLLHSGFFQSSREAAERRGTRSLINLVEPARHGRIAAGFSEQLVAIPGADVWAVPGLRDSVQADSMGAAWEAIGGYLSAANANGGTIVVDAGRLGHRAAPTDLIRHADLIAIVTTTSVTALTAVRGSLEQLRRPLKAAKSPAAIGLIVVEDGYYTPAEISKAVGVDIVCTIPHSPEHAKVFSEGHSLTDLRRRSSRYLKSLRLAWPKMHEYVESHRPEWIDPRSYTPTALPSQAEPTASIGESHG